MAIESTAVDGTNLAALQPQLRRTPQDPQGPQAEPQDDKSKPTVKVFVHCALVTPLANSTAADEIRTVTAVRVLTEETAA
jgi:hypothetical protein